MLGRTEPPDRFEVRVARLLLLQPPLLVDVDHIDYPALSGLGLWQAAAGLRAAGHDVTVLDAFCLPTSKLAVEPDGRLRFGVALAGFLHHLGDLAPDVVVIANSPWLRARVASAEIRRLTDALQRRWPGVPRVLADCDVGGMHRIAWDEADLDELGCDWGQAFEAEGTLEPLVRALAVGQRPEQRIASSGPAEAALDDLPPPAYDLIDFSAFQRFLARVHETLPKHSIFSHQPPLAPFKTSRGCAFRCSFCTSNPWQRAGHKGQAYRRLSRDALLRHVRLLRDTYGVRRLVVLDELANPTEQALNDLLDVAESLDLQLDLPNGLRADRLTQAQVQRLAARTRQLSVSAESAADRVTNTLIGKRFDLAATQRVALWARDAGLPLSVHWMVGLPDETRAEVRQTLHAAVELYDSTGATPLLQFAVPIRGTALHDDVTARKLWISREDRDIGPLFQGRSVLRGLDWTPEELQVARQALAVRVASGQPRKVIVNTTYVCNNHCAFCAVGNRSQRHADPEAVIAALREHRDKGFDLVDFDGGEPTTHPKLLQLLGAARDLGFREINLTTNGRMLAVPRNVERLLRSGLTHLLVSLHGPDAQVHDANVGAPGAFAQTSAGIAQARPLAERLGVGFGVNVTLTRSNVPHLLRMGPLLEAWGVRACNLQFLTPFGRASADGQPDPHDAATAAMALIDLHGQKIRFQIVNLPLCYLPGYQQHGLADLGKRERHMVFVGGDEVNLQDYLQARRRHEAACETCLFAFACEGFYFFPDEWRDSARARFGD